MTMRDVLVKAKELLTPENWAKGNPRDRPAGTLCAVDAIIVAAGGQPGDDILTISKAYDAVVYMIGFLPMLKGLGRQELCLWNDAAVRTYEEVVALFDKAIATLPEQTDASA